MSAPRRPPRRQIDGVLLLDKPADITSNGALMRVKRLYNAEKAGHTGTLDPLATGVLPICFGEATKFAGFLLDATKRYVATLRFGVTTTTQDADGDIVASRRIAFDRGSLLTVMRGFIGRAMQVPPAHSALKFEGRPYYDYARKGIEIPRAPRDVTIHALELVEWRSPDAIVDITCTKGTYVRALAADLGEALGCGAHVAALRRTETGGFGIANTVPLDVLESMTIADRDRRLLPRAALVGHLPALRVEADVGRHFLHGGAVAASTCDTGLLAVFDGDTLLGIADVVQGVARPRRVVAIRAG